MSKANALATALLEKKPQEKQEFKESFEVTKPALMSGFRGMFGERSLSSFEEDRIEKILSEHGTEKDHSQVEEDCRSLFRITSEIKAISNQSILLHGERIKRAQEILKSYKEGAFTAWLLATYGNRQTPYSMLQYFELYNSLAQHEKPLIENLPKKAAYTLASREGALQDKLQLLKSYKGEKQQEIIVRIRETFPKDAADKRTKSLSLSLLHELEKLLLRLESKVEKFTPEERKRLFQLGKKIVSLCH
jgi:hypothetical protein